MDERRLGLVVGLRTYATFEDDKSLATAVIDAALASGSTMFDSSPMYGAAERSLSAALRYRREAATVATKIWATTAEEGRSQYAEQQRLYGRVEALLSPLAAERDVPVLVMRPLEGARGAELRDDPGLSALARRSCDPRHVTNGTCCRGRGWRGGAAVRPRRTASRRETCRRRVMSDHECGMVPPR